MRINYLSSSSPVSGSFDQGKSILELFFGSVQRERDSQDANEESAHRNEGMRALRNSFGGGTTESNDPVETVTTEAPPSADAPSIDQTTQIMIGVGIAVVLILFALKDYLMKNVFAKKEEVEEEPEDMAEKESEDDDSDLDGDLKK